MEMRGGEKMNRKFLMLATVAVIAVLLTSSLIAISQGWFQPKPKPEYVVYDFKLVDDPLAAVVTSTDNGYPVVVEDAYTPSSGILTASVTINGVLYSFPTDFDYNYTFHMELNMETGNGLILLQETLYFKHLPGHPTLKGRGEEKMTGLILSPAVDISKYECWGNFQVTGTGMFRNVEGYGTGMLGQSTGLVVRHFALVKGWPL
jgi:hypothetical protein